MSWLLFLDESGHDHKSMPYEVRGGIAIHARRLWPFIQGMQRLELESFGSPLGLYKKELKGSTPRATETRRPLNRGGSSMHPIRTRAGERKKKRQRRRSHPKVAPRPSLQNKYRRKWRGRQAVSDENSQELGQNHPNGWSLCIHRVISTSLGKRKAKWRPGKKSFFTSAGGDSARPVRQARWPCAVLPTRTASRA
jgi:hypothetical protein